ncbi:MAG: PKD domain-containing protein [Bacteroidota bacterium]
MAPTTFCAGGSISLTASNNPPGSTFQWLKDGSIITAATAPTYTATLTGSYSVDVTSSSGTVSYAAVNVTVIPKPVASFTFSPTNQCPSNPVQFINTSTGTGITSQWAFADPNSGSNNSSTVDNAIHRFIGSPGTGNQNFQVSLTATSAGCTNSITNTITTKQSPGTELNGPNSKVINGSTYFRQCAVAPSPFVFSNGSSTPGNTSYRIIWGDNTSDFNASTFTGTISHTYNISESTPLLFIVTGSGGCVDTTTYYVYVGSNPAVGLGNPGNTSICSSDALTFPITGTSTNSAGTTYTVSFNDASTPITFLHPAPPSITHTFNNVSCGQTSSDGTNTYTNSYKATILASNPCNSSSGTIVPIYVSQKPVAAFTVSNTAVCTNTAVSFNSASSLITDNNSGTCTSGKTVWIITPSTGFTVTSGTRGNDNNSPDPSLWAAGSSALNIVFTSPGTYSIKLRAGNPTCGADEITKTVCVNSIPTASFTVDKNTGCNNLAVQTINTSSAPTCSTNTYAWTVGYSPTTSCLPNTSLVTYKSGSPTSANPEFNFINPGTYTIGLTTSSGTGCSSPPSATQTIIVKSKPTVTLTGPTSICTSGSITPSATVGNCNSSTAATYAWTFNGASPSSSTSANPGPITYSTTGSFITQLVVTNECGSTTITQTVTVNPQPIVTVPVNQIKCAGAASGILSFTSSIGGTTYTWANSATSIGLASSGSNSSIPSFTLANAGTTAVIATISVTPTAGGCAGPAGTFSITVNPKPPAPTVISPITYCLNATAIPLTATAAAGNTLLWYNSLPASPPTGGSATIPTPSTTSSGNTSYYVTQDNPFGCTSNTSTITVTVTPLVAGNTISADQTLCAGTSASTLTGTSPSGGNGAGSYNYQWQSSVDGGNTFANVSPGGTSPSYSPGTLAASTIYKRNVTSGACILPSNTVSITIQAALTNTGISANQDICEGDPIASLVGLTPTGGNGASYSYQWDSSLNNSLWIPITGAVSKDYQPLTTATTAYYRRRIVSGSCSATSLSSVKITINNKPKAGTLSAPVINTCFASNVPVSTTGFVGTIQKWQYNFTPANPATWHDTAVTSSSINFNNVQVSFGVRVIVLQLGTSCTNQDTSAVTQVNVSNTTNPGTTGTDATVCTGGNSGGVTLTGYSGTVLRWETSTNGTNYTTVANTTASLNYTNLTVSTWYRAVVQSGTCPSSNSNATKITVVPTVTVANAGTDKTLCNQLTVTLNGNTASIGTGTWTQTAGPTATIVNALLANTQITGLLPSQTYKFLWTIAGTGSCPSTSDEVQIINTPAITQAAVGADETICTFATKDSITLSGNTLINPLYETGLWSFVLPNPTGSSPIIRNVNNPTSQFIFDKAGTYKLTWSISNGACSSSSATISVSVYDKPSAGTLSSPVTETCIGNNVTINIGSLLKGNIIKWQYNFTPSNSATWVDTLVTNASINFNKVQNSFGVRVIVGQSGPCVNRDTSTALVITVSANSVGGHTAGSASVCVGTNGGTITLSGHVGSITRWETSVNNGTSWTNIANTTSSITYSNLSNSTWYRALVQGGSCTANYSDTAKIIVATPVAASAGADQLLCNQNSVVLNGNTPSGGTAAWIQTTGPVAVITNPSQTNTSITGLQAGQTYKFLWSITGIGSCPSSSDEVQIINTPAITQANVGPDLSICSFISKDSITLTGNNFGNSGVETGFWSMLLPNPVGSSPVIRNINNPTSQFIFDMAGTYRLIWTISNGACLPTKDTIDINVFNKPAAGTLTASATSTCIGNNITISTGSSLSGNIVKWQYNITPTNAATWVDSLISSTSIVFKNVQQSFNVRVIVKSAGGSAGCSLFDTSAVSITVIPDFTNIIDTTSAAICSGQTVSVTGLIPTGGAGNFQYQWQQSSDGVTWSNIAGQTNVDLTISPISSVYFRRVVTLAPCFKNSLPVYVLVRPLLGNFQMSDSTGTCFPFSIIFTNLVLPSTLTTWDFGDGAFNQGDAVSHTYNTTGTFQVKMTSQYPGGCKFESTKTVKITGPTGVFKYDHDKICGNQSVQFLVSSSNIDSVRWSFGDGLSAVTTAKVVFHQYNQPGAFIPSIELLAGPGGLCKTKITGPDTLFVDNVKAGFNTANLQECSITHVAFTDTARAFYGIKERSWDFGDGVTTTEKNPLHNYTATKTWNVRQIVTGNSGCMDTVNKPLLINVWDIPQVKTNKDSVACVGQTVPYVASVFANDAIKSTVWNFSNGSGSTQLSAPKVYTFPGTYMAVFIATTINDCSDTARLPVVVYSQLYVDLGPDQTVPTGTQLTLKNTLTNGPASIWEWTPNADLSCKSCDLPIANIKNNITYIVKATTSHGCSATDTLAIKVFCEGTQVYIPNVFTPDGDGLNDILMVRAKGIRTVKSFRIFNRWGEVVFERSNFVPNEKSNGWDGSVRGKKATPDVYVYTCEVVCENDISYTYKGNITLVK